jgi:dTDP-4-dehydrorhamnose 3,5-epimerase
MQIMNVKHTNIKGVLLIKPQVFSDERGFFYESWNERQFTESIGVNAKFVQENHSRSSDNVLRGLGYQIKKPQGKKVRVVKGVIFDVVVDLRMKSPTFGAWYGVELSENNNLSLWIPPGCAHGFLSRSEIADVVFMTTDYFAPEYERCIIWNDRTLAIDWNVKEKPILSEKDKLGIPFKEAEVFDF